MFFCLYLAVFLALLCAFEDSLCTSLEANLQWHLPFFLDMNGGILEGTHGEIQTPTESKSLRGRTDPWSAEMAFGSLPLVAVQVDLSTMSFEDFRFCLPRVSYQRSFLHFN